jgi:predicted transcriptional regulator
MLASIIRAAIRTRLINDGPQTCSDLVRAMGLDPRRHKGTIHALMVDLETAGVLDATRNDATGKRDVWFIRTNQIRKRDRIIAAMAGV